MLSLLFIELSDLVMRHFHIFTDLDKQETIKIYNETKKNLGENHSVLTRI